MDSTAVITLERVWGTETSPYNTASIRPFIDGIKAFSDSFDFYYSHFYGRESLREALNEFLNPCYRRIILQIAGHGSGKKIASTQFGTVFETIASVQKDKKFNGSIGLIMSSCLMGSNKELISQGIRQARLQWFFGYNCASSWMESTLIDTFLLYFLTKKGIHVQPTQDYLIKCFKDALALFDKNYLIGSDGTSEKSIREGLTLIISDGDFRRKPIDASPFLFT